MSQHKFFFIPAIAWLIISTYLLTMPGEEIPKENFFTRIEFDKWVHVIMFFIMTFLWCRALAGRRSAKANLGKTFLIIAIISFAYGTGMEFVQRYFTLNRSFDGWDIVADGAGCVMGFFYSSRRYIKK